MFESSRARPQGPELAVWSSGPGVPTASGPCNTVFGSRRASIRSSRHGVRVQACSAASGAGGEVRVTRHSKGGDEEKEEEELYLR